MATVDAKGFVHHYKNDGTCNVKIRVRIFNQDLEALYKNSIS